MSAWTSVPKPTESSVVTVGSGGGEPIGMLLALTYAGTQSSSITSGWGDVAKPTISSWTSVLKPTSSVWSLIAKPIS
jgi:hypothetical protein